MKMIKELFFYIIYFCILIIKVRSTKLNYCEIENLYCAKNVNNNTNLNLHVACNRSLNSKINNLDNNFFNGQIINLNDQLRHEIIKNLNKFRNRLASGKIKLHPKPASKMNALEWDDELEMVSRISLETSKNGDHIGCTATEKFPNTREIFYRINYFPNPVITGDDVKYVVEDVIRHFNLINKNSIAIGIDETSHIGCTLAIHKSKFLLMRCIVNGQQLNTSMVSTETTSSLYEVGEPCSQCTDVMCSQRYKSLCGVELFKRVRRDTTNDGHNKTVALKQKSKQIINTDDGNDDDAYDEEDSDDFGDDDDGEMNDGLPQQSKEYGDNCKEAEECHWPMVCEVMYDSKSICTCDESYYYYDSIMGTCLLDAYDMVGFVKQIVDEANSDIVLKIINNTKTSEPTINLPKINATIPPVARHMEISDKDIKAITHDVGKRIKLEMDEFVKSRSSPQNNGGDLTGTIIVAVIMAVLSLITWVVFIIFMKRLENSIDRKLEEKSGFRAGVNSS